MTSQGTEPSRPSSVRPVCVVGLGLIGGSLLRDLDAAGVTCFGTDATPATRAAARAEGFDIIDDPASALRRAEKSAGLLVVAVPMPAVAEIFEKISRLAPHATVIDVVSVKAPVLELARRFGLERRYVGTHPMAGTASSGWSAGRAGLFAGASWVIGIDQAVEEMGDGVRGPGRAQGAGVWTEVWTELWAEVARLISATGARLMPARAEIHDRAVARVSHLPHLLAEALAASGAAGGPLAMSLAAGSFRDGTRVAGTRPELVRAMCETNAAALLPALDEAISLLSAAREGLAGVAGAGPDISQLAEAGFAARKRFSLSAAGGEPPRGAAGGEPPRGALPKDRFPSRGPVPADHYPSEAPTLAGRSERAAPIFDIQPGQDGWVADLLRAEEAGAAITIAE